MTAKAAKASTTKKTKTVKPKSAAASKPKTTKVAATVAKPSARKWANNSLGAWNLRLGILLVVLAIAVVVAGGNETVPLTTQYLARDALASQAEAAGGDVLAPATRHLWDVNVSWLVAKFLLVFGVVYLLAATVLRTRYEAWLVRGINKLRWVGFGLGGGTVFTTLAMLSGVSDVTTLSLVCGSVVLAALLAAAAELIGAGRRMRKLLAAGAILAVFLPWLLLVRTAGAVPMWGGSLPMYMYFLYASVTFIVVAVGLALYMRVKQRGKWADTLYTEKMFVMLSLAAAVLPAMQIFAGALQA